MRIAALLTADPTSREAAVETRRLVELAARGHEVVAISRPIVRVSTARIVGELARGRGLPPLPRLSPFDGSLVRHVELERSRAFEDEDVPDGDLVLFSSVALAPFAFALSASKGAKVHFVTCLERAPEPSTDLTRARFEAGYRLPIERIAGTERLSRLLSERYDVADTPVVETGVDPAPPRPERADSRLRIGFAYPETGASGVRTLASALDIARTTLPSLDVVAYGNAPASEVSSHVSLDRYVRAPSPRAIARFYESLDAFAATRTDEGFELPVLEAMSAGVPTVTTPYGAGASLARGGAALLADDASPPSLSRAIVDAATLGVGARGALSALGRARAHERNWGSVTDALEAALVRIDERRKQSRARSYGTRT